MNGVDEAAPPPPWRRHLPAARVELIAIALFTLFLVWPFVRPDRVALSLDGLIYSGPNLHVTLEAFRAGDLPLWNRHIFGGVSHAGNPQTGFWYPFLALGLPFSTTRALNLISAAHVVLFVAGMVALCRWRLRLRPPATFIGTAVAVGCGAMATKTIQFEQLLVVAWVPLLLALLHWLVTGDRPRRAVACTALAAGAWLAAGHPQTVYLLAPLLVVWTVGVALDAKAPQRLGHATGAAIGGAVIALPHLLLAWRATEWSALSGGRTLDEIRAVGGLQGRSIVPGLLGDLTASNPDIVVHGFESTTYVGAAALVLAVAGATVGILRRTHRYTTVGLTMLAAVCLLLATGPITFVFRFAFDVVPGFDLGRVSARWALPASLCLAVLAAWGADAARDTTAAQRRAAGIALGGAASVAVLALLAYRQEVPGRRAVLLWLLIGGGTAAAWLASPSSRHRSARAVGAGLLVPALLVGGELAATARHSFARQIMTTVNPDGPPSPVAEFFAAHPDGRSLALTFDDLPNQPYLIDSLRPNVNATFDIASFDGYDGGVQITDRWAAVLTALVPTFDPKLTARAQLTTPLHPETWARLGVRYVVADPRGDAAGLLGGWAGPTVVGDFTIYENPAWRGDAVATFDAISVAGPDAAAAAVAAAGTGAPAVAVEAPGAPLTCPLADCAPVGLGVDRRSPTDLVVRADLAAPAVVSISEQYEDGWHATVDGERVDVVAVDGIRAGVVVPAGAHEIHFTYRPAHLTLSIVLSIAATVLALVAAGLPPAIGRRWQRPAAPAG